MQSQFDQFVVVCVESISDILTAVAIGDLAVLLDTLTGAVEGHAGAIRPAWTRSASTSAWTA